jgi:exodeoxyribonuclease VII large subunit
MPLRYNRFAQKEEDSPGDMAQPLTLYQLNRRICEALDDAFPESYWVIAEIAEVSRYSSGHCYLTLIDKGNGPGGAGREQAKAKATIWNNRYQRISHQFESQTGHPLRAGLKILLNASVKFHELHGLALDILHIDPNYTLGDLARQRQETINRLRTEGLLDRNKERLLPLVPQRLAVISSPTAAGLQDFMHQLRHNAFGYSFTAQLFPATVQGKEAVGSITRALEQVGREQLKFDAVVIIRGGGSQTDLYCFDQYEIAAAVAHSPLPVLTGIGHERDETVTDLVAHTRFKTPTAVAAFLVDQARYFEEKLDEAFWRIKEVADGLVREAKGQLERQSRDLSQLTDRFLRIRLQGLLELTQAIRHRQQGYVQEQRYHLSCHQMHLVHTTTTLLGSKKTALLAREKDTRQAGQLYLQVQRGRLLQMAQCLKGESKEKLSEARLLLTQDSQQALTLARQKVTLEQHRLELKELKISLHDPRAMLLRGYTLTYRNGKLVRKTEDLAPGDQIETLLPDGKISSTILIIDRT